MITLSHMKRFSLAITFFHAITFAHVITISHAFNGADIHGLYCRRTILINDIEHAVNLR